MSFRVLNNKIVFQFVEDIVKGNFKTKTEWGFQFMQNPAADVKKPRWGLVKQIGPEVQHVKEGDYVLIEPLMWTLKLTFEDMDFWYTNEEKVLLKTSELPAGIY